MAAKPQISFADWALLQQGVSLETLLQSICDFLDDHEEMIEAVRHDLERGLKSPAARPVDPETPVTQFASRSTPAPLHKRGLQAHPLVPWMKGQREPDKSATPWGDISSFR